MLDELLMRSKRLLMLALLLLLLAALLVLDALIFSMLLLLLAALLVLDALLISLLLLGVLPGVLAMFDGSDSVEKRAEMLLDRGDVNNRSFGTLDNSKGTGALSSL